jgi:thiol-disulfide isomerase/thioredoxin
MKIIQNLIIYTIVSLLLLSCGNGYKPNNNHKTDIVRYEKLLDRYSKNDNVLYIVNFWATWCAPCVEELPGFMTINKKYCKKRDFRMILVSLDDAENLENSVIPMAVKLNLDTEMYLLDDVKRMNQWIPAISKEWSGAIPATLFIKNGRSLWFHEGQLSELKLDSLIQKYLILK